MEQTLKREPRVKQSIAFRRDQLTGLRELAATEKHGNVSLIVQRAVDRELESAQAAQEAEKDGGAA